ncbi:DUF2845 domain-containing protein [Rhodanobacter sp. Si-c]|uniref:DUF2845 domain-containing protein n=1 Tax=Rhodanobacter lycopersici TaxID=3162487 RepID=A0ABV3QDZ6_9GAMM
MHRRLLAGLLACLLFAVAAGASASDSLRVGSRVLVVGDSAATVTALLGKPVHKSRRNAARGGGHRGKRARAAQGDKARGEQWQYRRDGRVIVVTLVDGRVSDIDERSR